MIESPESNQTTEFRAGQPLSELPDPLAWKLCRYLGRFVGSVFFPYFRAWGETDLHGGRRVFITRNYGLQTWLMALRVFKRPVRIVVCDAEDDRRWFELACHNGLAPLHLTGSPEQNSLTVERLAVAGENVLLVIPQHADASVLDLVGRLKIARSFKTLFMAVVGAREALPAGAWVPRSVPICAFCGLPHYNARPDDSPLAELDFLELALKDLDIDELPSIFFNHSRNQNRIHSI